jgi:pimeloyl-ACP methyl ester carboxylesterase
VNAIVVAAHGILTKTTDPSWVDDLDAYLRDCKVVKRRYFAGPFSIVNVFVRNRLIADALAEEIEVLWQQLKVPVYFVGHSNGTDVGRHLIGKLGERGIRTEAAIFTGSVLSPDVVDSGIAGLVISGYLGKAIAYCSKDDLPLRFARWLRWPYRDLGRCGWMYRGKSFKAPGFLTRQFDGFGHSGYFENSNRSKVFEQMRADLGLA